MSKFQEKFVEQFGNIKCKTLKKWTDELKDAQDKERVEKEMEDIERHKRIAKEVERLLER